MVAGNGLDWSETKADQTSRRIEMNANQIYAHLRAGQFRLAFDELHRGWQSLRWEVRSAIVGTLAGLLLIWAVSAMGWLIGLLAIPLMVGAVIALSRPTPVPSSVDGFVHWADGKRQQAAVKGSFFAKWVMRPFYAGLSGSGGLTAPIPDPYLRAGTTIAVQSYAVYLALAVASIAIYLVLLLACIAFVLWVIAYAFSERSGGGFVSRAVSQSVSQQLTDYSESREERFRQERSHGSPEDVMVDHSEEHGEATPPRTQAQKEEPMVTVKIIYRSSGKPVEGTGVAINFSHILSRNSGITSTKHTDERGEVHFHVSPDEGQIFVNGSTEYDGMIKDYMEIYI